MVAVIGGADEKLDLVSFAQHVVEALDLGVGFRRAPGVEEVVFLAQQQEGPGSVGQQQVAHFAAVADEELGLLLGAGGLFVFHVVEPGGDVAAGGDGEGPVVHGGHEGAHVAAAGVPRDADAFGIDFTAGSQIVEAPHRVPEAPRGVEFTHEEHLLGDHVVLEGGPPGELFGVGDVHQLAPFALTGGVGGQHHEAVGHQRKDRPLIGLAGLAVGGVSREEQHRGRTVRAVGDVQVGRDGQFGTAVIDHVFHPEPVALQRSGDPGVKGRLFGGELEGLADLFLEFLLVGPELLRGGDFRQTGLTFRGIGAEFADVVVLNFVSEKLVHDLFLSVCG